MFYICLHTTGCDRSNTATPSAAMAATQPHQPKATRKDVMAAARPHQKGAKMVKKVKTRAALTSWAESSESSCDSMTVR